jgi:hypothetical protein
MAYAPGQVIHAKAAYGVQTDLYFTLLDPASANGDLYSGTDLVAGDATITKDGGAVVSTTNTPAQITAAGFLYKLTLTAAELTASRVAVALRDQTATEVFGPVTLIIEIFGSLVLGQNGSYGDVWGIAPSAENTTVPSQTMTYGKMVQSLLARFFSRATQDGSNQKVYRADDSTVLTTMAVADDGTTQTKGKAA